MILQSNALTSPLLACVKRADGGRYLLGFVMGKAFGIKIIKGKQVKCFEYLCSNCGQLRISFVATNKCGHCGSTKIIKGKIGSLEKEQRNELEG